MLCSLFRGEGEGREATGEGGRRPAHPLTGGVGVGWGCRDSGLARDEEDTGEDGVCLTGDRGGPEEEDRGEGSLGLLLLMETLWSLLW